MGHTLKSVFMGGLLVVLISIPIESHAATNSLAASSPGGWNGMSVTMQFTAGYRQAGDASGLQEVTVDNSFDGILPGAAFGSSFSFSTMANHAPHSGALKDVSMGTATMDYQVGTATTADTFDFRVNTTTSAESAMVDFGAGLEPADAFVKVTMSFQSFGPLTGAYLSLPAVPALTDPSSEDVFVSWAMGTTLPPVVMTPGTPSSTVPITLGGVDSFNYSVDYSVVTPFGTDPDLTFRLSGATFIPEPSSALLLLIGFFGIGLRRSRVSL